MWWQEKGTLRGKLLFPIGAVVQIGPDNPTDAKTIYNQSPDFSAKEKCEGKKNPGFKNEGFVFCFETAV